MAVNIGPRIGVDGEAQYRAQINNIVQATKTLKAEMEQTAQEFKRSGDAMGGNKAKAEQLTKAIELQRDKVDKLRDMTAKAAEKYGEADTRTLKWKEALAQAQTELSRLEGEMGNVNPEVKALADTLADAGNKLKSIGGEISSAGETWTKYISAPIAATGAASIAAFKEVDKGTDTLIAKTGATGAALDEMKGSMEELATTIPTDFETAGNAVGEVNTRFGLTGDALTNLSGKFIKFAQLNNTDVSGSVDKVQASMAAWNMDSEKAGDVLDMLNTAGQQTGVNVDKLAGSLMTNSTALKEMGFDMESSISLLANFEKNGIDSSTAMGGLQKALQNAVKDGKPLDVALAELQTDLKNANTDTDAMSRATELFGKKAGPQLANAIAEGRISLDKSAHSLGEFGGSVEDTFQQTVDGADEFTMALNEAKATGAEVGKTLLTMAVPAIRKVGEIVKGAKEAWNGLSESQQETIIKIAGIVAAVGPALVVIGKITSAVGGILSFATQIAAAIGTASAFVSTTLLQALSGAAAAFAPFLVPAGLIIAGIVAATVLIVKNWDKIKAGAAKLKEGVAKAWEWFKVQLPKIVNLILPGPMLIIKNWDKLKAAAGVLKTNVVNAWNNLKKGVVEKATALKEGAEEKLNALKTGAQNAVEKLKNGIITKAENLKAGAIAKFEALKSGAIEKFNAARNGAVKAISELPGKVAAQLSKVAQKASSFGSSIKTKFRNIGANVINGIISGIKGSVRKLYSSIKSALSGLVKKAKKELGINSPSAVLRDEVGQWIPEGVAEGITQNLSAVDAAMKKLGENISTSLSSADGSVKGEKYAKSIADGIKNSKKYAKKSAKEVGEAIVSTAEQKLKNYQVLHKTTAAYEVSYWKRILKSCKKGTQAYIDAYSHYSEALNSYNDSMTAAKEALLELEEDYAQKIADVETGLVNDMNEAWDAYYDSVDQRAKSISNALGGIFDSFESKTENTTGSLISNLKSQTEGLKNWADNITKLEARIGDADLMEAIREMGPDAAADVGLLTKMSDEELNQYVGLWQEKMRLCKEQATRENAGLYTETLNQIEKLKTDAAAKMNEYTSTFVGEVKSLKAQTLETLGTLPKEFKSVGDQAMQSLTKAIASGAGALGAEVSSLMQMAVNSALTALGTTRNGSTKTAIITGGKVKWNARAYNNPLMFSTPTIVGGRGFGDGAGGEIVIGKDTMLAWIRDAVTGGGATNNSTSYGDINVVVNAAPGQNVRELADAVAAQIQNKIVQRRRAY